MPTPLPIVITIGETMALVYPNDGLPVETAESFSVNIGGAESNVACHLASLGVHAAWGSRVGNDPLGKRVLTELGRFGVDLNWVEVDPVKPTGLYIKDPGNGVHYYRKGSAASSMTPGFIDSLPIHSAKLVHISGISPALSDSCDGMIEALMQKRSGGQLLSFDVNHRKALWPSLETASKRLNDIAQRADIVLVGLDEADRLWGTKTPADVREMISAPRYLIVKDGAIGATEFARHEDGSDLETFVGALKVEVVEEVGAGDAFAAGYLAGLLNDERATARLQRGHERAALTLRSIGDLPEPTVR